MKHDAQRNMEAAGNSSPAWLANAPKQRTSFGKAHCVMFEADAIGNLRKELIENLGWDVARGVLERVGYQSGRSDALALHERYPWPSEEECLPAGRRLDYLEGIARVGVLWSEIDRATGRFHIAGCWPDSHEAEQHLKHYGPGDRAVCWALEGYATGFATEFFGEKIVALETSCRGRGDSVCGFELRPEPEWGAAARPLYRSPNGVHFSERFDRCLRAMTDNGCELEQSSLDAIFTTDPEGRITSCNQGGSDLLVTLPGEIIGRPAGTLYAEGAAEARRIMDRLTAEGRIRNHLTHVVTSGGSRIPIALSAAVVRNERGEVAGTIGVARNLTELRKLEDELAAKNRFMANILQDSADAIITLDAADVITSWNRGAEQVFGYTAAEMIGRSVDVIVPPELRAGDELGRIRQRLRAGGSVRSYQTERITKDGRRIEVVFTRTAIFDDAGKFQGSSAVLKEVTNVLNLERQFAEAEHLANLGALSAGLAHEIKNPLAGIKGAIEVIRDSPEITDLHREVLRDVLHEVHRIDRTVRELLSYAKPRPARHTAIHLPELAQRIVTMLKQTTKEGGPSITFGAAAGIPGFTGDESQIEAVLVNLLLNSTAAMARRIRVSIWYDSAEASIGFEVADDGRGMPEEVQKQIFRPFFTTRADGTGLGLPTCLKNIQYHGGTIAVESKPGEGSRFRVTLPLVCRL